MAPTRQMGLHVTQMSGFYEPHIEECSLLNEKNYTDEMGKEVAAILNTRLSKSSFLVIVTGLVYCLTLPASLSTLLEINMSIIQEMISSGQGVFLDLENRTLTFL